MTESKYHHTLLKHHLRKLRERVEILEKNTPSDQNIRKEKQNAENKELEATTRIIALLTAEISRLEDENAVLPLLEAHISSLETSNSKLKRENEAIPVLEARISELEERNERLKSEIEYVGEVLLVSGQLVFSKVVTELSMAVTESCREEGEGEGEREVELSRFVGKVGEVVRKANEMVEVLYGRLMGVKKKDC